MPRALPGSSDFPDTTGTTVERLPVIHVDFVLEVVPPRNGEIQIFKIRELLYRLRDNGVNIRWVTFDGYQSRDCIQVLRQKGFITGIQSVDRATLPYELLKSTLYDHRLQISTNDKLRGELLSLEFDAQTGKVDHPTSGSKDLADALAGVVYGLTLRREVWVHHKVSLRQIPPSIAALTRPAQPEVLVSNTAVSAVR